jgi:hypothetical protein
VAKLAQEAGVPVVCIAGHLGEGHESSLPLFASVEVLSDGRGPLPTPVEAARQVGEASRRAVAGLLARGVLVVPAE